MAWNLTAPGAGLRQGAGCADGDEPQAQRAAAIGVGEALAWAKGALEAVTLVVEGEVSQFKDNPSYKAAYFPLADKGAVMDCMMWRNRYAASGVVLRPGLKVRVTGRFSVYPAKGRMQFEVFRLEPAGEGDLRERVARLARKLQAEGLMDASCKRPIPVFCQRVVVITSPHGKVKDDVARTLRRRNPLVALEYCPVTVEGATAAAQMVEALRVAEAARPDAILLVRGGGSYEDLMPFNDEALARAVAACRVPVVTGIGHEPDTTICDMVSDRRASTPTAAAESVAPSVEELEGALLGQAHRMASSLGRRIEVCSRWIEAVARRPVFARPASVLVEPLEQRLDFAHDRLVGALPAMVESRTQQTVFLGRRLAAALPGAVQARRSSLEAQRMRLLGVGERFGASQSASLATDAARLGSVGKTMLEGPRRQLAVNAGRLDALSPLAVIARGYAMAVDPEGNVVSSVGAICAGEDLSVRVSDGTIECVVQSVSKTV